jgi:glycosyltransferase involved in cell wall biosynthesis
MKEKVVVCFGPGPKFKGGIQNYNTSLALAFDKLPNTRVHIVSWTQQYPAIVPREFVDKSSKSDLLEGSEVSVTYLTNYNKPKTWRETARHIISLSPDVVVFQWSIALQGLPIGSIIKKLKKAGLHVVVDVHFVIQKEHSALDKLLTKFGLKHAHSFVTHAMHTLEELKLVFPQRTFKRVDNLNLNEKDSFQVLKLYHPIYDLYQPISNLNVEDEKEKLGLRKHVFLFFGFIRRYKGLDQAIQAFAELCKERDDVSLLICGENFWQTLDQNKWSTKLKQFTFGWAKRLLLSKKDDERNDKPLELITKLGIENQCVVFNRFIPNEEVPLFFQVSDAVLLYYRTATPSGIESLSYNFKLPILATSVGHFPETIKHGFNGYLAEAEDIKSMTDTLKLFIAEPIDRNNVAKATANMSWENYAKSILKYEH